MEKNYLIPLMCIASFFLGFFEAQALSPGDGSDRIKDQLLNCTQYAFAVVEVVVSDCNGGNYTIYGIGGCYGTNPN